jgi:E3 ubiquitin-protein ligase HUWE1
MKSDLWLSGVSGNTKFTITAAHKQGVLPSAHSCFNQLDLPTYESCKETFTCSARLADPFRADEDLRKALLMAITETEGFG